LSDSFFIPTPIAHGFYGLNGFTRINENQASPSMGNLRKSVKSVKIRVELGF